MYTKDVGARQTLHRLAELRALKDNSKRVFGKDITNVNKRSKNLSIHESLVPKVETKPRSVSFKKDVPEKEIKGKDLAQ